LYTDHFAVEAVDIHQKVKCQGSMGKGKARPRGYHTSKQVIKLIDDEIDHTLAVWFRNHMGRVCSRGHAPYTPMVNTTVRKLDHEMVLPLLLLIRYVLL
jgi:hypothetical protein